MATALDTRGQVFSTVAFQITQASFFCCENSTLCDVHSSITILCMTIIFVHMDMKDLLRSMPPQNLTLCFCHPWFLIRKRMTKKKISWFLTNSEAIKSKASKNFATRTFLLHSKRYYLISYNPQPKGDCYSWKKIYDDNHTDS